LLLLNQVQADKVQSIKLKNPSLTDDQKIEMLVSELYKKNSKGKTVYDGEEFPWNGYIIRAQKDQNGNITFR
jgi:hypothetical protein